MASGKHVNIRCKRPLSFSLHSSPLSVGNNILYPYPPSPRYDSGVNSPAISKQRREQHNHKGKNQDCSAKMIGVSIGERQEQSALADTRTNKIVFSKHTSPPPPANRKTTAGRDSSTISSWNRRYAIRFQTNAKFY